jgi:hypothetical protein
MHLETRDVSAAGIRVTNYRVSPHPPTPPPRPAPPHSPPRVPARIVAVADCRRGRSGTYAALPRATRINLSFSS